MNDTGKRNNANSEVEYFDAFWDRQMEDSEFRAVYEEEAQKKELWLQLVEARQAAGLTQQQVADRLGVTQAQVARVERRGYDAYTLNTLRRYVHALGEGFTLRISVQTPPAPASALEQRGRVGVRA